MHIQFGTSGLRGAAGDFDAAAVDAFVSAFIEHVGVSRGDEVFVGCDLRASSPAISGFVASTIRAEGLTLRWCGVVPTPALAVAALARRAPAVMITGSHIPEDQNGIKFYRPDGELMKSDEAPMRALAEGRLRSGCAGSATAALPPVDPVAAEDYRKRYLSAFGRQTLGGLRLGLFEHSAAGRGLLADILGELGAEVVGFGRRDDFVAVDTEALDQEALAVCAEAISRHGLDAVVSTDGDGDRPLLIDAGGSQVAGDVLGTLTARALGIDSVVTPLTSTGGIELSGWFDHVTRTRIGSPHVITAMHEASGGKIAGFEPNGGFMLWQALDLPDGRVPELPTRDAVLPLIVVLAEMRRREMALSELVAELPPRTMKADRLKCVPRQVSDAFLSEVTHSSPLRAELMPDLAHPAKTDLTDGVRFHLDDGTIVHFRASGNAPELRAYVESDSADAAEERLRHLLCRLQDVLPRWPDPREDAR